MKICVFLSLSFFNLFDFCFVDFGKNVSNAKNKMVVKVKLWQKNGGV